MSETTTAHNLQPIDDQVVAEFMALDEQLAITGAPVTIDRGNGPEQYKMFETVHMRETQPDGQQHVVPKVVLEQEDGSRLTVDAKDYLIWSGFDPKTIEAAKQKQEAEKKAFLGGAIVDQAVESAPAPTAEELRVARIEKLFKTPFKTGAETEVKSSDFDHMFMDDAEYAVWKAKQEQELQSPTRKFELKPPSEADLASAREKLGFLVIYDEGAKAIFNKYGERVPSVERVTMLQTNQELRNELGAHFLDKMNDPEFLRSMPPQVRMNSQKSSNQPQYSEIGSTTSREYVCLLAMSMLDGSFRINELTDATTEYNRRTDSGGGQHRYAAQKLISGRLY